MTGPTSTKTSPTKDAKLANGHSQEQPRQPTLAGPQTDILALQSAAGNGAVSQLVQSGGGRPLAPDVRRLMETRFDYDFTQVRVHTNGRAAASAGDLSARAYTVGQEIVFGQGYYAPHTQVGRQLLTHELAHVVQQTSGSFRSTESLEHEAERAEQGVIPAVHSGVSFRPVLQLSPERATRLIIVVSEGRNRAKFTIIRDEGESLSASGTSSGLSPGEYRVAYDTEHRQMFFRAADGSPLPEMSRFYINIPGTAIKMHRLLRATTEPIPMQVRIGEAGGGKAKGKAGETGTEAIKTASDRSKAVRLAVEEEEISKRLAKLTADRKAKEEVDPKELVRLYRMLIEAVRDPQSARSSGRSMVRFARFLEKNKDKIEGILSGKPPGVLTLEKIQQIIAEYDKFIAAEPVEEDGKPSATLKDFEQEFRYDPGWQRLSEEDRKLLIEYAKLRPDEVTDQKVDFTHVTTDMKVSLALKLSWGSWPREIAEAAKNAFSDPWFIITLITIVGIYVGLWLTPDPSLVTKVLAGTLTVVLLAQFAWDDIYGLARAWMELRGNCARATNVRQLKAAGNKFAKKVGVVGFDILMFIVMWRVGRRVGPKVRKYGVERATTRAKAKLAEAEAKPGSGKRLKATAETAELLKRAKSEVPDPNNPSSVLDALSKLLPKNAQEGLIKFRSTTKSGDAKVLRTLEGQTRGGLDITHFLAEKALTPEAIRATKAEVLSRYAELTWLRLIEIEAIKDPVLRAESRAALIENLRVRLTELGILRDPKVIEAAKARNLQQLRAAIAEAAARAQMLAKHSGAKGIRVLGNLEVVREVPQRTVAEWQAAKKAAGETPDVGKLRWVGRKLGGEVVAEIDALATMETSSGKLRPLEISEIKAAESTTGAQATAQLNKAVAALEAVQRRASSGPNHILTERTGSARLGSNLTSRLDLSNISSVMRSTVGLAGKTGFTGELPFSNQVLSELAKSIARHGLPPEKPARIPPMSSERLKRRKKRNSGQ